MKYKGIQLYPWYKILWNIIWLIPVVTVGTLFLLVIGIAYGPKRAISIYYDIGAGL